MDRIGEDLTDLSWWFTVIIVGLLVNLLATAITKGAPRLLGNISARWAERNEKARRAHEDKIKRLMENEERRADLRFHILRSMSGALLGLVLAIVAALIPLLADRLALSELISKLVFPFSMGGATLALFLSLSLLRLSIGGQDLLAEAQKRLRQEDEPADEAENDD